MWPSSLGLNDEAQSVVQALLRVAGLVAVAIGVAWKIYGARIAELYEPEDFRDSKHASKMSLYSIGDPALKASASDWTRTWHAPRREVSPARCVSSK